MFNSNFISRFLASFLGFAILFGAGVFYLQSEPENIQTSVLDQINIAPVNTISPDLKSALNLPALNSSANTSSSTATSPSTTSALNSTANCLAIVCDESACNKDGLICDYDEYGCTTGTCATPPNPDEIGNMSRTYEDKQRNLKDWRSNLSNIKREVPGIDATKIEKLLSEWELALPSLQTIYNLKRQNAFWERNRLFDDLNGDINDEMTRLNNLHDRSNIERQVVKEKPQTVKDLTRNLQESKKRAQEAKMTIDFSIIEKNLQGYSDKSAECKVKFDSGVVENRDLWDCLRDADQFNNQFWDENRIIEEQLNKVFTKRDVENRLKDLARYITETTNTLKDLIKRGANADDVKKLETMIAQLTLKVQEAKTVADDIIIKGETDARLFWDVVNEVETENRNFWDLRNEADTRLNEVQQLKDAGNWTIQEKRNLADRYREIKEIKGKDDPVISKLIAEYENHLKMAEQSYNNKLLEDFKLHQQDLDLVRQDLFDVINQKIELKNKEQQARDGLNWLKNETKNKNDLLREIKMVKGEKDGPIQQFLTEYEKIIKTMEAMAGSGSVDHEFWDMQREVDSARQEVGDRINELRDSMNQSENLRNAAQNLKDRLRQIKDNEREYKKQIKELKSDNEEARLILEEIKSLLTQGQKYIDERDGQSYWDEVNMSFDELNRNFWNAIQIGWQKKQRIDFCQDKPRRIKELREERNRVAREIKQQRFDTVRPDFEAIDKILESMDLLAKECLNTASDLDVQDLEDNFKDAEQDFHEIIQVYYNAQRYAQQREELRMIFNQAVDVLTKIDKPTFKDRFKGDLIEQCRPVAQTLKDSIPQLIDRYSKGEEPSDEEYRPYWVAYSQAYDVCGPLFAVSGGKTPPPRNMSGYVEQNFRFVEDKETFEGMIGKIQEDILQRVTTKIGEMNLQVINQLTEQVNKLQESVAVIAEQVERNISMVLKNTIALENNVVEKLLATTTSVANSLETFSQTIDSANKERPKLRDSFENLDEIQKQLADHVFLENPDTVLAEIEQISSDLGDSSVSDDEIRDRITQLEQEVDESIEEDIDRQIKEKVTEFGDSTPNRWYYEFTQKAFNEGIVTGLQSPEGKSLHRIEPSRPTFIAEAICMFVRPTGGEAEGSTGIASVDSTWARGCFAGALKGDNRMTVVGEVGKGENPFGEISRGRAFRALAERLGFKPIANADTSAFGDEGLGQDPNWPYVAALGNRGIVRGNDPEREGGKRMLLLKNTINRAELLTILMKALERLAVLGK